MFFQQITLKKSILFVFSVLWMSFSGIAQPELAYKDMAYSETVKTVQLYPADKPLDYPVIELNSDEKLVLEFDDFFEDTRHLSYTYIHCTPDWQPSDLMQGEYIDGYPEDEITDYTFSFNTLKSYNHYRLEFPTERCKPILSGNYILLVFEDFDRDKILLSARFRVVESKILINTEFMRSTYVKKAECCMQFKTELRMRTNEFGNYSDGGILYILRNNDDRFGIRAEKPDYIKGNVLEYNNPAKYSLAAGSEFRYVNLKDRRQTTDKVVEIGFIDPYYIFTIYPEKANPHIYTYIQDINGKFVIAAEGTIEPATEAEYVLADFTFYTDEPYPTGDVYLYGDFTHNQILPENKMEYQPDYKAYRLRKQLKQGFYNYWYVLHNPLTGEVTLAQTEGDFYETENDYVFYFYYRHSGELYHRLIGYEVFNSHKKL